MCEKSTSPVAAVQHRSRHLHPETNQEENMPLRLFMGNVSLIRERGMKDFPPVVFTQSGRESKVSQRQYGDAEGGGKSNRKLRSPLTADLKLSGF